MPSVDDIFPDPFEDMEDDATKAKLAEFERRKKNLGNLLAVIAVIIVSFCAGGWIFHGSPNPTRVVTKTRVIHDPSPVKTVTVTVAATPESCQAAIQYTSEILPYISQIMDASDPAINALQNAFVAISTRNYAEINKAQTQIHNIQNSIADPTGQYESLLSDAQTSMASCLKQLNK